MGLAIRFSWIYGAIMNDTENTQAMPIDGDDAGFITGQIWFSAFIAWLLKAIILQYGGPNLFPRLRPFFLGMILGEATTGGLWLVIDALTGNYGNRITAM